MVRPALVVLALVGGIVLVPASLPTPAQACMIYPFNTKAEIAAIRKALPKARISAERRAKIEAFLNEVDRPGGRMDVRALTEAMEALRLRRIGAKEACLRRPHVR
jgi:hypothetical protein